MEPVPVNLPSFPPALTPTARPFKARKRKAKPRVADPSRPFVVRWTLRRWAAERHALGARALKAAGPALLDDLRAAHADAGEVERAKARCIAAADAMKIADDALVAAESRAARWLDAGRRFDALVTAIAAADAASEPKP